MAERLYTVPADHPSLPGHFPGAPVLPGVVLLDLAWSLCTTRLPVDTKLRGVPSVKFLRATQPGDILRLRCTGTTATTAEFQIHLLAAEGELLAAQGRFTHG